MAVSKTGCCAKGMKCCENNAACCSTVQECCREGAACCNESKALASSVSSQNHAARVFEVRDSLPRSPAGKVLRHLVEAS